MKKIIQFSFVTIALAIIYFTNVSYSSGPPDTAVTGGCSCHGPASANTIVQVSFNGGNLYYNNGQTYPIVISVVSSNAQPFAGFALSTNVGTFGTPPSGTQVSGSVWKHSSKKATSGVSPTFASWTINWTAPASGALPLQLYAAGNAVNGSGSNGDFWSFAPSLNVALPVVFTDFSATSFNNKSILNWSVAEVKNVKEYQIERSVNGKDFATIGTIEANNLSSYQFIDESQLNSKIIYYQIKAIDIDGKSLLSDIKIIKKEHSISEVKIYPTIISANENLTVLNAKNHSKILIYSSTGQLINTTSIYSFKNNIELNMLSKGMYFVFINSNNETKFIDKIIVQ